MKGLTPLEVKNVDTIDALPYAVMEVVRLNTEFGYLEVRQPTGDSLQEVVINSGNPLKAGNTGTAYSPYERAPYIIQRDPGTTPATGQDWGTISGQWYLKKDKIGFTAYDVSDSSKLRTNTWAFQMKVCSSS